MRTATTPIVAFKPTASESTLAERHEIIRLTEAGWSATAIAAHLGCCERTVTRWRSRYRAAGEAGVAYRSRRPQTPARQATPDAVVAAIQAIRTAHPGWGARLIQHQLGLDGVSPLPSERTVHSWLRRLGCPPVRARAHKPLGFPQPPPTRDDTLWEVDHKKKGGVAT